MNINEWLGQTGLEYGNWQLRNSSFLLWLFFTVMCIGLGYLFDKRSFLKLFTNERLTADEKKRAKRYGYVSLLLLFLIGSIYLLNLNQAVVLGGFSLSILHVLGGLLILLGIRILDIVGAQLLVRFLERKDVTYDEQVHNSYTAIKQQAVKMVRAIIYVLAAMLFIRLLQLNQTFTFKFEKNSYSITITNILFAVLILLSGRLIAFFITRIGLRPYYVRREVNPGLQYAINQLITYTLFIITGLLAVESLGISLTLLMGGAAALLLGVGLGLQQTFNDLFSGILLLFERSIEVGDFIEIDGSLRGSVEKIGLRTSQVKTRDNITVIVPNSKLVTEKIVNWSHSDKKARFFVQVGVAYGSDTMLVKKLLLEASNNHKKVLKRPAAFVRMVNFGESSLDFELHFWSTDFLFIEDVKSDIRLEIDRLFRKHKVTIPFPQRDLWIRENDTK